LRRLNRPEGRNGGEEEKGNKEMEWKGEEEEEEGEEEDKDKKLLTHGHQNYMCISRCKLTRNKGKSVFSYNYYLTNS
jgi:hypothetical protein